MSYKTFLETFPLYRKFKIEINLNQIPGAPNPAILEDFEIDLGHVLSVLPRPSISMTCHSCGSDQTFVMNPAYRIDYQKCAASDVVIAPYLCAGCSSFYRVFVLHVQVDTGLTVMKVGQFPPWDISVDQNLAKMLGDHLSLYKSGLACESQSYGVGAHAYYRRIVEAIIDHLLAELEELIGENDKEKYKEALEQTKKTKVAQQKIALVKDLLPAELRPRGMNPLAVLHDELSSGLHSETDDECLESAEAIRSSLIYLIKQVMQAKAEAREFTNGMKKLLDKKSQKKKQEKD